VQQQTAEQDQLAEVDSFHHHDAQTIRPRWTGEPFDLHACVHVLFAMARDRGEDGQHEGGVDNTTVGSDNTSDNT
jgi:hypothetical protein